jgi:hypothetical protein
MSTRPSVSCMGKTAHTDRMENGEPSSQEHRAPDYQWILLSWTSRSNYFFSYSVPTRRASLPRGESPDFRANRLASVGSDQHR